jgi:regulator of sigma E protease
MEVLVKASQLILSLSLLIVLHEAGHFIPARLFKIRVEKFYLFFDPWFSLFKRKRGDTEYGIGWLPLGGYVKISGMVDESMDKEQMKLPPQPWEFRAKPAWQRLIVMLGGVTVNVILGFLIYMMIAFTWGDTTLPNANVKYGIMCDDIALNMGLMNGDKIVSVDGEKLEAFNDLNRRLMLDRPGTIEVNRNGELKTIQIPRNFADTALSKGIKASISPRTVFAIAEVQKNSGADKGGVKEGDIIVSLNGEKLPFYDMYRSRLPKLKNTNTAIGVVRSGKYQELNVHLDSVGMMGVAAVSPSFLLGLQTTHYSFFEAIPKGVSLGVHTLVDYIKQFRLIFSKAGVKQIGGFGTFGSLFAPVWDWESFWKLTAFISIILAVMNVLPIPALDGGHVMFLLYEIITRRKPNQKAMEYAQMAGMIVLLALFLFANGNDVFRHFRH